MFYCLSFCFILYFFGKIHTIAYLKEKSKLVFFSSLYILFTISYDPYFDWKIWLLISLLLYCVLDDIWYQEFNILIPLFVSILFFVIKPSVLLGISILFVFGSFYLLALPIHMYKKRRGKTERIFDSENDKQKAEGKPNKKENIFAKLTIIFGKHSGMGEGDPWIVCSFLFLLPLIHWVPYLLLNWVFIILFFSINHFLRAPRKSIPFAPILLLSMTVYLLSQTYL